jgi:hypothetical protein
VFSSSCLNSKNMCVLFLNTSMAADAALRILRRAPHEPRHLREVGTPWRPLHSVGMAYPKQ